MSPELRQERPEDFREAENVTREAFWNRYSPGCHEHYLLHVMRSCPDFVPELAHVAVCDGRIAGHIAYAVASLHDDSGRTHRVLTLGPVSVLPAFQRKGVGSGMIEHTARLAEKLGYRAIFLCGDPDYYLRRGFAPAENLGIRAADDWFAAALLVRELKKNALAGITGRYVESPVYEIDESASAEYDRTFPPGKKLRGTPSQARFHELAAMRRKYIPS